MKLFCEACQRIGAAHSWSVIDGVLRVACAACGVEAEIAARPPAVVAAATPPAPEAPAAVDGGNEIDLALADFVAAPTPGPASEQATRWNLAGASFAEQETGAALALAAEEESLDDDPWLPIGWAALQQSWSDPAAHRRLLAEAAARGEFAGLGTRYRDHLARHPGDAVALGARDDLLKKATAQMFTRLPLEEGGIGPARARVVRNAMLVVFLLGLIAFGGWVLAQMGGGL